MPKSEDQKLFPQLAINWDEVSLEYYSHYTAVEYYLTVQDQAYQEGDSLEKVRHYLEAFYHLSEVKDWQRCIKICLVELDTPTRETLHNQLGTWGYYHQQADLYQTTLDKVNSQWCTICLNGLGNLYNFLGNYKLAIEYLTKRKK